jgi:predicted dehydrogenase
MIGMAIVGVGWAGTRHVEAIRELNEKLHVACLVDTDPEHLRKSAEALGVEKVYTEYAAALADPDVHAVSICTPHALHAQMAIAAAAAGKHILCEKPLAATVEDANRMVDAARQHDVKLFVAENATYAPMSSFLHHVVQSGEYIGELTAARMASGFQAQQYGYPGRRAWLADPAQGGTGTWMLHGIHSMAQLRYVLGEVETVYMREHKASSFQRTDLEGSVSGLLTLQSGVAVQVLQTAETKLYGNLGGYVLHGDRGSVRASRRGCEVYGPNHGDEPRFVPYPESDLSEYALEMDAFADYVNGRAVGPTTGESERRSLAIVQAGYESMQSGQPVHLRERFGEL